MKIVFYSLVLNNHQVNVADELWKMTGHSYCFVELANLQGVYRKGDSHDYCDRPYLLQAWKSNSAYLRAMELARIAECCVFSGVQALPFLKERMKLNLLSFDMSERWLKRGFFNLFSPAIFKMFLAYHIGGWRKKPIYKLCCSAFAAADHYRLFTYLGRCYKWGYFTRVEENLNLLNKSSNAIIRIMWCSRFLQLKHPELPILLAHRLKSKGYQFMLDMYGDGAYENSAKQLASNLGVEDVVIFNGSEPNEKLLSDMQLHSIFLFTSDKNEGWGAVANESMANGCVLVASDAVGSSPYLIENGQTGLLFRSPKVKSNIHRPDLSALDALCEKVEYLLDDPRRIRKIQQKSIALMQQVWNPRIAAERLLILVDGLCRGVEKPFPEGPCSKA